MAGGIYKKFFAVFLGAVFFAALAAPVFAQPWLPLVQCGYDPHGSCTFCDLFELFENIVNFVLFTLVPPLAVLMLVIGGAMFFFAAGDPGKLNQAKSIFMATITGLAIIYGAWLIINLFFITIGVADWTGLQEGWFQFQCVTD